MKTLHVMSQSWLNTNSTPQVFQYLNANDGLLLRGDAVLNAIPASQSHQYLQQLSQNIYLLEEDIAARGLVSIIEQYQCVNMQGFVRLCMEYDKVQSWPF